MGFLSLPEYVIKKGKLHGHRYGNKPRDKEYYLANQLKKNCKKKVPRNPWSILSRSWFPCPNDWKQLRWRSLSTMGCSCRWKSHSPPVRTRKLLLQEQMVVPSQKSGVLTPEHWKNFLISTKHCLPWNVHTKKLEKNHSCTLIRIITNKWIGTKFIFNMVELARFLVVFLKIISQGRSTQSLANERKDRLLTLLCRKQKIPFKNSIYFVKDRSCTTDGGLLLPTGGVKTTSQMTRFRDVQQAIIMATVWIDDDKNKVGLRHEENLELRMRGETERQNVRHQWRRDNQDQHNAHETRHLTSECARGPSC